MKFIVIRLITQYLYVFVCFSRIVSESKTLVNGIDACVEQTATPDQNEVENNSFTDQSSSLCLPPAPVNSPVADSTDANVRGSSWFAGLTTVVDSPNSYPKWRDSETSLSPVTSCGPHSRQSSSSVFDADVDDDLEPPAKRQLLQPSWSPAGSDVSTTAVSSPLLGQLLSSSAETSDDTQSHDDDQDVDTCSVDSSNTDSSTDLTCMPSGDSINDTQHEGLSYNSNLMSFCKTTISNWLNV